MQDPRLSKYQSVKKLGAISLNKIDEGDLSNKVTGTEMQGSILKTWVNLIKRDRSVFLEREQASSVSRGGRIEKLGFIRKENKITKIAKYFLAIGLEKASEIISELDDAHIISIIKEIAEIKYVTPEDKKKIIKEFEELVRYETKFLKIDNKFTYDLLNKSLSKSKAKEIYKKITGVDPFLPFDYLSDVENEQLWFLIGVENVKTLLIIYNYLSKEQKKYIFSMLDEQAKKQFIKELAKPRQFNMDMVETISNRLKSRFEMQGRLKTEKLDGSKILVDILSYMDSEDEKNLLKSINMKAFNPIKDGEIKEKIFDIDVILRIMDNDMHNILREFTDKNIAMIIKDKNDEIRNKILLNVSKRRKEIILEEENFLGKLNKNEIKQMTTSFISYIKELTLKGEIIIYRKNEEFV
ncbi:flagellar motor switch protein FliG [Borrelia sp. A-FGy1]|uniref:flagellar motor switch protein FliG n=1 Tax=Borrelia sp. A-FGy1 TaxID=2608247 RepID=UPI0015F76F86|nr:flagellar motor switch protein FliG [Borrelia sp. A-FGy1]QMU99024.1 flagellar motor switch protein FliG [Borrelia sp. A-FGy1]